MSCLRTLVASLIVAMLAFGAVSPAVDAQPKEPAAKKQPTQKTFGDARKHFDRAEAAKMSADYPTAVSEYLAAFDLIGAPALIYDVAEAYRLAGDRSNALAYYAKYLELDPNGSGSGAAREASNRIRAAMDDAAATPEAEAKHKAEAEAKRKAEVEAKRKAEAKDARDPVILVEPVRPSVAVPAAPLPPADERKAVAVTSQPPAPDGHKLLVASLVVGGAGVATLGTGIVFGFIAQNISNEASTWDRFDQKRYDQGKRDQHLMFALTGVGAAALITSGVLYYVSHRERPAIETSVVTFMPAASSSEVSLSAVGRF